MKKRRVRFRFIFFLFIILLTITCGSIYIFTGSLSMPTFIQADHATIKFPIDTDFIPLSTGYLAINDIVTRYDKKNQSVSMDDLPESFLSFSSLTNCNNHLIVDEHTVYEVVDSQTPLLVHTLTEQKKSVVDVNSLKNSLLLTTYDGISSYSLNLFSENILTPVHFPNNVFLLGSACEDNTNNFSVLCFTDDGPFLGTTIISYKDNEIIGEIVLHDTFYYDILRFNHTIILIGTSDIACYNIESGLELWHYSFATPSSLEYTSSEFGALIVSSDAVFNNQSLILINSDGSPVPVSFNKPIFLVDNTTTGYVFTTTDTLMQVTHDYKIKHVNTLSSRPVTLQYNSYLRCAYTLSASEDFTVSYVK